MKVNILHRYHHTTITTTPQQNNNNIGFNTNVEFINFKTLLVGNIFS